MVSLRTKEPLYECHSGGYEKMDKLRVPSVSHCGGYDNNHERFESTKGSHCGGYDN